MAFRAEVNADVRSTAVMLRTEVTRRDGTDWFTIDQVSARLPGDIEEAVVAETLEAMVDGGLLFARGGKESPRRFFPPETLRGDPAPPTGRDGYSSGR